MQLDFHYSTIRILAEKAGFSPKDAQIIAYASEFVDDATEHKKMKIKGNLKINSPRFDGTYFDPVCSAHKGLQFITDFKKSVQEKIYMCFHFLPPKIYKEGEKYSYITRPRGEIAELVLNNALNLLVNESEKYRTKNLIKLGVALHSYADTWAHQGFSGRHSSEDNDIDDIAIFKNNKWEKIGIIKQFEQNILPDIGHAEAIGYPDTSYMRWRYKNDFSGKIIERNNLDIFIEASTTIFNILSEFNNNKTKFSEFESRLIKCFSLINDSKQEKFEFYKKTFPEIGFYYNSNQWRDEALIITREFVNQKNKTTCNAKDLLFTLFLNVTLLERNT